MANFAHTYNNSAHMIQTIDALYTSLANNKSAEYQLYEELDRNLIAHTPLHDAAAAGETLMAMEIATLKPSFALKLNGEGLSPMHLALQNRHIETVRSLLTIDPELVRVKGKFRMTPLHYAAAMNEGEIVAEFLLRCPTAIEDLNSECESALHIAVKNRSVEAYKVILGWLVKVEITDVARVINWKDGDGNTVLHIATTTNQPEVLRLSIPYISAYSKNLQGESCLDLVDQHNEEVKRILLGGCKLFRKDIKKLSHAEYLSRGINTRTTKLKSLIDRGYGKGLPMELRNVYLVVAALIVTATFQAILSPPGGNWQDTTTTTTTATAFGPAPAPATPVENDKHTAGKVIMAGWGLHMFFGGNTVAFIMSLIFIVYLVIRLPYSLFLISPSVCLLITYAVALGSTTLEGDLERISMVMVLFLLMFVVLVLCSVVLTTPKPEALRGQITKR